MVFAIMVFAVLRAAMFLTIWRMTPFISIVLSTQLVLGCHQLSSARSSSRPQNRDGDVERPGTTHGGGGNGVEGRPYEAYIQNPTELEAYHAYVRPRIANILGRDGSSESTLNSVEALLKSKTWVIAPMTLKPVDMLSLGVVFSKSETQQLGLQFKDEIWIDKTYFDKMTVQEQGQLILHEFVMLIYFLKFESFSSICTRFFKGQSLTVTANECSQEVDAYLPVESLRPLNDVDYQNIRRATALLDQEGVAALPDRVLSIFRSNGFKDILFFSDALGAKVQESVELSGWQLGDLIQSAVLTHAFLPNCLRAESRTSVPCALQVTTPSTPSIYAPLFKTYSFQYRSGEETKSSDVYLAGAKMVLPKLHDHISGRDVFMTVLTPSRYAQTPGVRFYNLAVFLDRDPRVGSYHVVAVTVLPYVVTSELDRCVARRLVSTKSDNEGLVFARSADFLHIGALFGNSVAEFDCAQN